MAFSQDITLAGDASSSRVYAETSQKDGNTIRKVASAPLNAPEVLQIKHQESSRGGVPLDRHVVRLDLTKITSAGLPVIASVYMTFEVPRDSAVTVAMIKDMRTQMNNFTVDANVVKLLNGEP